MNGAPAKPISATPAGSSPRSMRTASATGSTCSGTSAGIAATAAASRTGCSITGPMPLTMSRSIPAALSGTTMSENRIAASVRCRRTGCSVISQTKSGRKQDCSMPIPSRTLRYSGSERPACRMNHTGRREGVRPDAAASSGYAVTSSRVGSVVSLIVNDHVMSVAQDGRCLRRASPVRTTGRATVTICEPTRYG
ncbi:hypothetical protein MTP03_20890 [Tsukamurella sp. PLM1]|nr:hypothetical protein MTP03_20890 [Tsukamurella sp. PLM1]